MQLMVKIGDAELKVLLDSGSTHNFIAEETVAKAGVTLQSRTSMSVIVANGDRLASSGRCPALLLRIDDDDFNIDCRAIPLDRFNIVLDVN